MDKHRLVMIGVGLGMLAVVILGYLLGVQPQLAIAAAASAQTVTAAQSNTAAEAQLVRLRKDFANLDTFKKQLQTLQQSIPPTASLDALLADLRTLAASTGTTISQFTPAQAVAYIPPALPAAPAPTGQATSSPSPSASAAPAPAPVAPVAPHAPAPVTNPLITPLNFVAVPVTVGVQGSTDGAIAFLDGLQHGSRLVLVTGFSGSSTAGGPAAATPAHAAASTTTYTISGFVYVLAPSAASTSTPAPATK